MLKGRPGRVDADEFFWATLESVMSADEGVGPKLWQHWPHRMRSGQSSGPIKYWVCDFWGTGTHSCSTVAPVCYGGHSPFPVSDNLLTTGARRNDTYREHAVLASVERYVSWRSMESLDSGITF